MSMPWSYHVRATYRFASERRIEGPERPLSVGEITARAQVGQSTVSAHLERLGEVGFVVAEHVGTSSRFSFNRECLDTFPSAAEVVMGKQP